MESGRERYKSGNGCPQSGGVFDVASKGKELEALDKRINDPGFWDDPNQARLITKKRSDLDKIIEIYQRFDRELNDILELVELSEDDQDMLDDMEKSLDKTEESFEKYEFETMLGGQYDRSNALMMVHSGAGGTESQDWTQMLFRMYKRWAERRNFKFELLDILPGDEAGIKSVTFQISGDYAYGYCRAEGGVHRLVRISPFDANSRRHTSFASVFVYPEIDDDIEVEINPSDLKIDVYRSSGPGGQGVNTTDSAVRITHLPSGIVITCQNERSQLRNREIAMRILKARLVDIAMEEKEEERRKVESEKKDIAWGSQIRSYVLHPYQMIKDHRTEMETGKVEEFLDGNIDSFMEAFLRSQS
ncbi:peptide chain release factor 2 [bacterium]|nr:peptide chain release factor 2 [candidate division CSSED10-310 bacterium]